MPRLSRPTQQGLCLALIALPMLAAADESLYSLKLTNDTFSAGGDEHYTNGVELTRISVPDQQHWTRHLAARLPGWSAQSLDAVGYHLAHQIYTPNNIEATTLLENDRPYAGLLLGGISLFDDVEHDGWREASVLDLEIGLVGPATGAEKLQNGAHHILGSEKAEGWDNQLENEPILNLGWHKAWWAQADLGGLEMEYGPHTSLALGNLYTYAGAGGTLRFGEGLDNSFGVPSVAPAMSVRQGFLPDRSFGWYGFVGVEGRYMAHNLLLDGNTFEDSHDVERQEWVGDLKAGVAFNWGDWQLAYTAVWRTKEFKEQTDSDRFGSLTLSTWL
ncbi:lipid A deacylase LpxR family protein [Modicisalibacter luteus]|uniref:Lipid A deacylase LpxR family protein n=1 Tax=Modicisalibacter luteus TaxID=453962 RepID=A0ABV7M741_9GAMM|nr:lipid A deacylase LpxR family protein [Halomonas lutea]GHB07564.1 membrane protein [Halomonas lutea]